MVAEALDILDPSLLRSRTEAAEERPDLFVAPIQRELLEPIPFRPRAEVAQAVSALPYPSKPVLQRRYSDEFLDWVFSQHQPQPWIQIPEYYLG